MVSSPAFAIPAATAVLIFAAIPSAAGADTSSVNVAADSVLAALSFELSRSMRELGRQNDPPYFMSYEVTETRSVTLGSSFGALTATDRNAGRLLDIDLRVGSPALDNSRRANSTGASLSRQSAALPMSNDPAAIRSVVWLHTDAAYKDATQELHRGTAEKQVQVAREDSSDDFSPAEPGRYADCAAPVPDTTGWAKRIRRYSRPFRDYDSLYSGDVWLSAAVQTVWYVNSEGAAIRTVTPRYTLSISGTTRADDGMTLPLYRSYVARSPGRLPADSTIVAVVDTLIRNLLALRRAPVVEPYSGPAILSGVAAAVFFHEILGHRLEGQRMKNDRDGQTFKKKIGEKIIPDILTIVSDPTMREFGGIDLNGAYAFDNQGVAARPVVLIDKGVLRAFMMSRTLIEGFTQSNGHGRKSPGFWPTARQANLIARSDRAVRPDSLRAMLARMCRQSGKPYGLCFKEITGGYTMTGRLMPNAFNVTPLLVSRVYTDGREELVRGVDLIGTPLSTVNSIVATDDAPEVFNGTCGSESGGVPVSAISPALLVSTVEVQKKPKSQDKLPLLPPPRAAARAGE